jgi:hypothetical protein
MSAAAPNAAVKQRIKAVLGPDVTRSMRLIHRRMRAMLHPSDLGNLALLHGSDKWMSHWYTSHYAWHFAPLRTREITLLEIGIGGHGVPDAGGASLRMWKHYFPRGRIFGLDIFDKRALDEPRIKTFRGDQSDPDCLRGILDCIGTPDIIIDDGSHINAHVLASFRVLFPALAAGGIYAVEDMQTSYWRRYGGGAPSSTNPPSMMDFFKDLADGLNHEEFIRPGYVPSYFDENIRSIHFYHNLMFIQKGRNKEGSIIKHNLPIPGVTELGD